MWHRPDGDAYEPRPQAIGPQSNKVSISENAIQITIAGKHVTVETLTT